MDNHTDKVIYFFNFQTLIMVLGEYEFNDMFEGRFDDMPYAHAFNMALLVFLAIIGRYISIFVISIFSTSKSYKFLYS